MYISFPAEVVEGGWEWVCVYVRIYLKKADTYRHAFPKHFFSLFIVCTAMLGGWQFVFQKKELIKNSNKFHLEGMQLLSVAVLIRTANTLGTYLKFWLD